MRVIAGSARSVPLITPKGLETRPTSDQIKETLFNMLQGYVEGSNFLDLFAGSGQIGVEALSRGAGRAVVIEQDKEALRIIIENINNLSLENKCRAYKNDVFRAIEILDRKNEKFDIIFMDPPYKENISAQTIEKISESNILSEEGIIISEHSTYEKLENTIGNFVKYDERDYNKKIISFYRLKEND